MKLPSETAKATSGKMWGAEKTPVPKPCKKLSVEKLAALIETTSINGVLRQY
ncbi:hypothetical protein N8H71_08125 [Pseudomonas koreensis]|uniref:hypothetical protein n=1 Tax=Pseudomonas koreensis TaxID=198620 RepID=UPI0021C75075|nr:hypothetical protein [Pseudomonas koreensis]MCU0071553.1 hypothetical protein [Pseudomonas koreensis]